MTRCLILFVGIPTGLPHSFCKWGITWVKRLHRELPDKEHLSLVFLILLLMITMIGFLSLFQHIWDILYSHQTKGRVKGCSEVLRKILFIDSKEIPWCCKYLSRGTTIKSSLTLALIYGEVNAQCLKYPTSRLILSKRQHQYLLFKALQYGKDSWDTRVALRQRLFWTLVSFCKV